MLSGNDLQQSGASSLYPGAYRRLLLILTGQYHNSEAEITEFCFKV